MAGSTLQVNIVAADHPVWHGTAKSVTIPASEGGMGILPDHEPVLTVIKEGTIVVVDPEGESSLLRGDRRLHLLRFEQAHRRGRAWNQREARRISRFRLT